jgi:hypothetical protein
VDPPYLRRESAPQEHQRQEAQTAEARFRPEASELPHAKAMRYRLLHQASFVRAHPLIHWKMQLQYQQKKKLRLTATSE